MPWTYLSLTQAITDWSENPGEPTFASNIQNMVRMAELRIAEQVQLNLTRTLASGTLTAGVDTVGLPADYLSPYAFKLKDMRNVEFFLKYKEEEFRRAAYPDPAFRDRPEYYSVVGSYTSGVWSGLVSMAPKPDWAYPYVLTYFSRPTSIVDATTTYIGNNAEDVLFFACMKNAAIFMKEEADVIKLYDDMYQESVSNFKVTGQGRARKDWYRKPDKKVEV